MLQPSPTSSNMKQKVLAFMLNVYHFNLKPSLGVPARRTISLCCIFTINIKLLSLTGCIHENQLEVAEGKKKTAIPTFPAYHYRYFISELHTLWSLHVTLPVVLDASVSDVLCGSFSGSFCGHYRTQQ